MTAPAFLGHGSLYTLIISTFVAVYRTHGTDIWYYLQISCYLKLIIQDRWIQK